jgi:sugar phosphate isomerase/epimerase
MEISACTDEISADLVRALDVLERHEIRQVDLRGVWGRNVIELDDAQAARVRELINARGFRVTALSTPIGKTPITAPFASEEARFRRALELARLFEAPALRVFSFRASEAEARDHWPEALDRLGRMSELAAPNGVTLAHENEEGGFCAWRPEECLALHRELPANVVALFEPCSFAVMGYDPFVKALPLLRPYLGYLHVRDTRRGTSEYCCAGEGDARWPDILADLHRRGYAGCLTLEPHLGWGDAHTTDEMRIAHFERAVAALRTLLANL